MAKTNSSGKLITCVLILLPGKAEELYLRALLLLDSAGRRQQWPDFEGARWLEAMIDFELALGNALKRFKPILRLKGCYFHYCQAVVRYSFLHCHLKSRYTSDRDGGDVRMFVRSLLALAHVESSDEMSDAREALFSKYETQRADIWSLDGTCFTTMTTTTYIYIYIYIHMYMYITYILYITR